MKGFSRLLMGIGVAVAIVAVAMPVTQAQCPTSREFGAQGNGMLTGRIIIDTGTNGFPNDGNEFASFWDPATGFNNGGDHFGGAGLCPTAAWYLTGTMLLGTNSGIQGFVASPGCTMNACPGIGADLAVLVEDQNAAGTDAGFILYVTQETPAAIRWYDHASTAGTAGTPVVTTDVFQRYPTVDVTGSAGPPPNTTVTNNYADLALNFHGSTGGMPNPNAGQGIMSYDIMSFHGAADPGRLRNGWTLVKSVPYGGGGVVGDAVLVPCPTTVGDTFLAVGATFAGGVQSLLVGSSVAVECDPNIADPDGPSIQRPRRPGRKSLRRVGR